MREREDLIAAPDAQNLTVVAFTGGPGKSSDAISVGSCAYFSVGLDNGSNGGPLWWILFGDGPSMPAIDPLSTTPGIACFGPYRNTRDFYPVCGQTHFRVMTATNNTHYVRVYRSSVGR